MTAQEAYKLSHIDNSMRWIYNQIKRVSEEGDTRIIFYEIPFEMTDGIIYNLLKNGYKFFVENYNGFHEMSLNAHLADFETKYLSFINYIIQWDHAK